MGGSALAEEHARKDHEQKQDRSNLKKALGEVGHMSTPTKTVRCAGCLRRQEKVKQASIKVWRKVQSLKKGKAK